MTIRAGGRVVLMAATGLLACVVGVSCTVATSAAAETKSEQASTSGKAKQVRYYKRHAYRKYARTVQKAPEERKPVQTEATGTDLPASVANANARMGSETADAARPASALAGAALTRDQPSEGQGAVSFQVAEADQLNEIDKAIQEPSQTTVAVAPAKPVASARTVVEDTSTWDRTSLIGKIFIAFGALLTVASAARMFMA